MNCTDVNNVEDRRVSKPSPQQMRELLEPESVGRPHRLTEYILRYRQRYVHDSRTVLFDVHARLEEEEVVLQGMVGVPGLKEGLTEGLFSLGLKVRADDLVVLPPSDTDSERYGLVSVSRSFLRGRPEEGAENTDELLLGEPLLLLGISRNEHCLVQTCSGYLGWVRGQDFRTIDYETWRIWHKDERVFFEAETELGDFTIPAGAQLPVQQDRILLPDQTSMPRPSDLVPVDPSPSQRLRERLMRIAEKALGREYVWAGRGGRGLDCSGFTHMVYAGAGIFLPRDADQQHLVGRVSATPDWRDDLAPGDLLFFTGPMGNIVHVALSIGGCDFIHAKGGMAVMRGSLNPESDCYEQRLERCFLVAKRVVR